MKTLLCTGLLLLSGCTIVQQSEDEAHRRFFDAVGPEYRAYVSGDARLDDAAKKRRLGTVDDYEKFLAEKQKAAK